MYLSHLRLRDFRNIHSVELELPPDGALFLGPNGSGKTNLLEAVHLLCTGRSQRGAERRQMIRHGESACFVEGVFHSEDHDVIRSSAIGFSRDRKVSMMRDGHPVGTLSAWFGHGLVISFSPEDISLISGSPRHRRRFLDIVISQIDQKYLEELMSYRQSLLNRNQLLTKGITDAQLDIYEERMAGDGAGIYHKRQEVLLNLATHFSRFYAEISQNRESAEISYSPSISGFSGSEIEWKNVFLDQLRSSRQKDVCLGFSSVGPHRDDVKISLNSRLAKGYGSQGQCRSLALSLRLSSVFCTEQYRKEKMIFLVDDAFSELDHGRVQSAYPLLEDRGQVLLTSPGPALVGAEKTQFSVSDGEIRKI